MPGAKLYNAEEKLAFGNTFAAEKMSLERIKK
jgi:hypothetical protein